MNITTIVNGKFGTNTFIVTDLKSRKALVIDPAEDTARIIHYLEQEKLTLLYIVNTHGHPDHIAGNKAIFDHFNCSIAINPLDEYRLYDVENNLARYINMLPGQPKATLLLEEGDVLTVGSLIFQVIVTPGHTEGGISLYLPEHHTLFSGDTLFYRSMGRVDLPGGDLAAIKRSLAKLCRLPEQTAVYPGHGQFTTIGFEKEHNRFCLGEN